MNVAMAIELMQAGHSDRYIARQVHVATARVSALRLRAGIPKARCGPKKVSVEDRFWRLAEFTDDGHMLWPIQARSMRQGRGPKISVRRVAFRIRYQRDPIGAVRAGCDHDRCIHPDHVEDQAMRQQYRAIFGRAA